LGRDSPVARRASSSAAAMASGATSPAASIRAQIEAAAATEIC
jgi:hypothetical protein